MHVQFAPSAYRFSGHAGLLPLRLPRAVPLVTTVHEYGGWAWPGWLPGPRLVVAGTRPGSGTGRPAGWSRPARRWSSPTPGHAGPGAGPYRGGEPTHVPLAPNVDRPRRRDHRRPAGCGRSSACPSDAPLLVFFGFVHPVKGIRHLIEALPALRRAHPDLRLLVAGGFASQALPEAEARAFRAELTALDRTATAWPARSTFTEYLTRRSASRPALHAADVVVLPFTAGREPSRAGPCSPPSPTACRPPVTAPDERR